MQVNNFREYAFLHSVSSSNFFSHDIENKIKISLDGNCSTISVSLCGNPWFRGVLKWKCRISLLDSLLCPPNQQHNPKAFVVLDFWLHSEVFQQKHEAHRSVSQWCKKKKKKCGTILSGSDNCTESAKSQLWHWGMSSGKTEGNLRSNCLCLSFRLSFICTVPAEQSWQMGTCCAASVCSLSLWSGLCKAAERHSEFSILEFQSGGVGGVRTPVGAGSLETACFFKASSRFGATANLKWKWWVRVWLRVGSKASGGKVLQCVWALQPFSRGVSIRPGLQRWSWGVMWTAGSWNLLLVRVISNQVLLLLFSSVVEESLAVQNKQCSHGVLHSK